ncbi:MAG: alpha/beta hydrolase, partial [Gammaproteobacteria bacterium]|nr:alpha/beta hydrolase [Gammaproteobacteria bacterium]
MGSRPYGRAHHRGGRKLNNQDELSLEIGGQVFCGVHWQRSGVVPVIALHGWLDNAATWSRLLPLLDSDEVLALDLAGHGRSDHRPPSVPYHFIDNVGDVIAVADAMGWQRFGLLGHSLGASVATLVAGTVPDRVSRLICIEGFGPLTTAAEKAPRQLAKSIARYHGSAGSVRLYDSVEAAARTRAEATKVSIGAARILCERGTRIENGQVCWS